MGPHKACEASKSDRNTCYRNLVHSVVALPGYARGDDKNKLDTLINSPVAMIVGALDRPKVGRMQDTQRASLTWVAM